MSDTNIPYSHIVDAHKLDNDGMVSLFRLAPPVGGTVDFKNGVEYEYQGILYESLPCRLSGEKWAADNSTPTPRLVIGQPDLDLLPFKALIHEGLLEGSTITRHKVLLDDMLKDNNYKLTTHFKVKRVEAYGRQQISLLLSTFTGASRQTYPFRQYTPPSFPWVKL